ncbi:MAG: FAD-binding oxidoreductase, partial [Phaeodactylibacter sp.]|nr:FAD-binding oxidoreductase [Phaeodactylibacter sp.]
MSNSQPLAYQLSFWEQDTFFRDVDIVVVGSGIVGLSAALRARELAPSSRILVLERGALPIGASTRNAGFACFGSVSELLDDMSVHPEDAVWALVERRWRGLQRLRQRIGDARMRYESWGGYELFRPEEEDVFERCAEAIPVFNRRLKDLLGIGETFHLANEQIGKLGFRGVGNLLCNTAEGQLHAGEMVRALIELVRENGIEIYNGLGVQSLEDSGPGVEIITNYGWSFRAGRVIVATNGLAQHLLPSLPVRPARNQVLITAPIPGLSVKGCFHYDRGYYYFRNVDGRILLGGGRNLDVEGETTSEFGTTPLIRSALVKLLQELILPGQPVVVDSWWSGILGVGGRKSPIIAPISDHVVVAVRLGGMGVAIGALVGEEGAELLLGHG